jgi:hypothetical protein
VHGPTSATGPPNPIVPRRSIYRTICHWV